mmetsp:Transcript_67457/g.206598  ORF Transcript_67457/g.206598 Transcript_67457/m.206598 type:complete len:259 (+) Transcript_67457:525-1301(+)
MLNDLFPSVHEEFRVARGVVDGLDDGGPGELHRLHTADGRGAVCSEQHVIVAGENASVFGLVEAQQTSLVALHAEHGEAEERRRPLDCEAVRARPERGAAPGLVVVLRVRAWRTGLHTLGPAVILGVALQLHAEAALRVEATFVLLVALRLGPRRQYPPLRGLRGRARTRRLARPAWIAASVQRLALAEISTLQIALLAFDLAAAFLRAGLPARGAHLVHPRLLPGRPRAELLARPRRAVDVGEVGASRYALGLARGE